MDRNSILILTVLALAAASTTCAQGVSIEIAPFAGYRTGAGFDVLRSDPGGQDLSRLDVNGSVSYGAALDVVFGDSAGEFLWSRQQTEVEGRPLAGGARAKLFDANLDTFLFNGVHHFAIEYDAIRPFILGGIGWSRLSPDSDFESENRFAFALGTGVKIDATDHFGFRFDARYSPTYVKSDPAYFCDIFGRCWVVGDAQYLNQFEFTGGVVLRF